MFSFGHCGTNKGLQRTLEGSAEKKNPCRHLPHPTKNRIPWMGAGKNFHKMNIVHPVVHGDKTIPEDKAILKAEPILTVGQESAGNAANSNGASLTEPRFHLAAIVDSADDAIVSKDLTSVVKTWNAAAQRMFGYAPEEMIGQSILKLIPKD